MEHAMTALETLKTWYDRVWLQGDLDAIDELFNPDTEASGMMDFAVGPEDFKALVPAFLAHVALEDICYDKVVEMGDWVWASMSAHATARVTETPVHVTGQIMVRVQDGHIVEAYNQFDFLALFEQLGYLPPDSLALCLSGEGLGLPGA
jgi:ketosteroid isomerase-like protein